MIKEIIADLVEKKNLSKGQMHQAMEEIMSNQATPAQIAGFLVALRIKGETVEEITGAAEAMRRFVRRINLAPGIILDTCGTGGDGSCTINISTISAFVASGSGVVVAKHGNRAVSGPCGSADVLEALGVNINIDEKAVEESVKKIGIGFLYAPTLHPAMKYASSIRKDLGVRTIFNLLGPLTNPAFATHQLIGVYQPELLRTVAGVLKNLGVVHALVVRGLDGLDEITTCDSTEICELQGGSLISYKLSPRDFGIEIAKPDDLKSRGVKDNAEVARDILKGKKGPHRDIVLLNAGAAIYAADRAKDIDEGIALARDSIDSGKAIRKLEELIRFTNEVRRD